MVTVRTYRYLRVAIVALALLLGVSVVVEIVSGTGLLDSVSEYYYTDARNVFVGVLCAVGVCLIVIKGRRLDDALLNAAGLCAVVVAMVPTPFGGGWFAYAPLSDDPFSSDLDIAFGTDVDTSIWSLLVLALVALAFAWWTIRTVPADQRREAARHHLGSTAIVLGFGAWFVIGRESFDAGAHYVAATSLFALLTVVSWRAAATASGERRDAPMVMKRWVADRRARAYRGISVALVVVIVTAGILALLDHHDVTPIPHWLFWIEAAMLGLFSLFWLIQTIEYWYDGSPEPT